MQRRGKYQIILTVIIIAVVMVGSVSAMEASFIKPAKIERITPYNETVQSTVVSEETKEVSENGAESEFPIKDNIDLPFVDDEAVKGLWKSVDFVENINDFLPGYPQTPSAGLYMKYMLFEDDGVVKMLAEDTTFDMSFDWLKWTKNFVVHYGDHTSSAYTIKEINDDTYMFFEWKSGDYTLHGIKPKFYVLKQVDEMDEAADDLENQRIYDDVDMPFVNDEDIIGQWESIDFVEHIEDFDPSVRSWISELYLNRLIFDEDGVLYFGIGFSNYEAEWTKGYLIEREHQLASAYSTKEIDGETYLFIEWKSGDYVYFGMDPQYYVLKQVDENEAPDSTNQGRIYDNIDLPFVMDEEVVGHWESIDFIENMDEFNLEEINEEDYLRVKKLDFKEDYTVTLTIDNEAFVDYWTKGTVICLELSTASAYTIEEIDGAKYLIMEYKGNDYIYDGAAPQYYVFKEVE